MTEIVVQQAIGLDDYVVSFEEGSVVIVAHDGIQLDDRKDVETLVMWVEMAARKAGFYDD